MDFTEPQTASSTWPNVAFISIGAVEMLCFLIGTPGSLLVLTYFITKKKTVSTFLYACISFVDVLISLMALAPAVSHFHQGDPKMFSNKLHCHVWGYFSLVCALLSVILIAVLSIARTVALALPFHRVKKVHVLLLVVLLSLAVLVVFSFPFYLGKKRGMYYAPAACGFDIMDVVGESGEKIGFWILMTSIILPFCIILTSCCVSVYSLRSVGSEQDMAGQGGGKGDATVTIVLLTVGYIIFTAPVVLWRIITGSGGEEFLWKLVGSSDFNLNLISAFLQVNTVQLNSVFNVGVYFWRMQRLRQYVKELCVNVSNSTEGQGASSFGRDLSSRRQRTFKKDKNKAISNFETKDTVADNIQTEM